MDIQIVLGYTRQGTSTIRRILNFLYLSNTLQSTLVLGGIFCIHKLIEGGNSLHIEKRVVGGFQSFVFYHTQITKYFQTT